MKTNQASILLYGHEEQLLATRQWVLQSRGYRVVTMMDLEGLASVPSTPPVRLLLLCHTLSAEEATAAIDAVSARWPRAQSLTLEGTSGRAPSGLLGQLLHTMDGPAKLIAKVGEILGSDAKVAFATRP
jgi:hypothetical protein